MRLLIPKIKTVNLLYSSTHNNLPINSDFILSIDNSKIDKKQGVYQIQFKTPNGTVTSWLFKKKKEHNEHFEFVKQYCATVEMK